MRTIILTGLTEADTQTVIASLAPTHTVHRHTDLRTLPDAVKLTRSDMLLVGYDHLEGDNREWLQEFNRSTPALPIMLIASTARAAEAGRLLPDTTATVLVSPFSPAQVRVAVDDAYSKLLEHTELEYLRSEVALPDSDAPVISTAPVMAELLNRLQSVAPTRTTVLLTGETGTGKSTLARQVHRYSNRNGRQFISVHCGAIPETLVESELFGHERGAFTGAVKRKLGKFEIASGGTIFLDEIGTVSPAVQIKLLNVLQERTFQRIGGTDDIATDVRIIAATNENLRARCAAGTFREDLYYRLCVFPLQVPPLRTRAEDITPLAQMILNRLNTSLQKSISGIHPRVTAALTSYAWPGNIRELENLMERACILETTATLMPESFPAELFQTTLPGIPVTVDTGIPLATARKRAMDDAERTYLKAVLTEHRGRIAPSAAAAGISTRQLHKLLQRHGIRKEEFRNR